MPCSPTRSAPASLLLATAVLLGACASGPTEEPTKVYDPDLVATELARAEADEQRQEWNRVLLQIDQALDSYVRALSGKGIASQDQTVERLDTLLRQLVSGDPPGSNTERLIAMASGHEEPVRQGLALAALGFADTSQVMPVILQGAQTDDPFLVDRAVLGLAILKDPRTPPGVVIEVLEDPEHPEAGRIQAAWALYVMQENSLRGDEIPPVWVRILEDADTIHPLIVATAVRGLGASRDRQYADLVARFATHPTPRVRFNTAIALGRMNAQDHAETLIAMLGPAETAPNVRLAARKALQTLAGGVDRGYDVELWRREFQRGDGGQ